MSPRSDNSRHFEGRFLDGQLEVLMGAWAEPGPGYAVALHDGRLWRNGEHVGQVLKLKWDRDVQGWWVHYVSWRGSPLDHPEVVR